MSEERKDWTIGELPTRGPYGVPLPDSEPRATVAEDGGGRGWDPSQTIGDLETLRPEEAGLMMLAGRYRAVKRLGEGGMGSVWLAEDTKLDNRKVAVKMLPAVLAGKKAACRQVKQEALLAMKLAHPNIATVRAFEEEGGNPFLVMDYIEGTGLDDILGEKGKLSEAETVKLLAPVAAALDYAHERGVVHRDVKPGNVIVDRNGTPFVLDFGIAREIQETMTRVTGKFSSGTLMYMSPEQLRGRAPKAAQDVYSFAAMAYECLKGKPPFARGQVEYQIVNEAPEPLPEGVASKALREGVLAGLAKDPEKRPGSCAEVLGLGEAAKRAREAEEAQRRRQEEERLAQERTRVEYEKRREAQALEAERAARKAAEEKVAKACEEARVRGLEAMKEKEARGRAAGWAWVLAVLLVGAGGGGGAWWYNDHQGLQQSAQSSKDQLEQERSGWEDKVRQAKEAAKAEREKLEKQQADAAKEASDAKQQMDNQRAELARQWNLREEALKAEEAAKRQEAVKAAVQDVLKRQRDAGDRRREKAVQQTQPGDAATPTPAGPRTTVGRQAGATKIIQLPNGAKMEMAWCPAGSFTMGSANGGDDEKPPHEVTLTKGFWMAKTEVTQGQWKSVMGRNPAANQTGDNYPVESVSWEDVQEFCKRTGLSLPTEAEWEYACRAGTTGDYGGTGDLGTMGWYSENSGGETHPVGEMEANAWGLKDMHGNVWEWCEDAYDSTFYAKNQNNDPKCVSSNGCRVLRGGSFWFARPNCRSANRNGNNPDDPHWNYGFRPVLRHD